MGAQGGVTRLYYFGPMFRYERPQGGRYRQFYQLGCELFGADSLAADLEIISLATALAERLGVAAKLKINFIGCAKCKAEYSRAIAEYFGDKTICADCARRRERNPLRILDCKVPSCRPAIEHAPTQKLCEACGDRFDRVTSALPGATVDRRMVRGLDYYTGLVFEMISEKLGAQDAILGGGRYDKLVEELGGQKTPAIGFAIGLDRLASLIEPPEKERPEFYVIALDESSVAHAARIAARLRVAHRVEQAVTNRALKGHFKEADKSEAKFVLLIGEKTLSVRNMATRNQIDIAHPENDDETVKKILEIAKG